jgi:hypothetical protein
MLTSALRHDSPKFRILLKRVHGSRGNVCGDKANSCKENAKPVRELEGRRPFLMPRKNASSKVKRWAWKGNLGDWRTVLRPASGP